MQKPSLFHHHLCSSGEQPSGFCTQPVFSVDGRDVRRIHHGCHGASCLFAFKLIFWAALVHVRDGDYRREIINLSVFVLGVPVRCAFSNALNEGFALITACTACSLRSTHARRTSLRLMCGDREAETNGTAMHGSPFFIYTFC